MTNQLQTPSSDITAVQQLYANLIGDAGFPAIESDLWNRADAVWDAHPELVITQGAISGTIRRKSVSFALGSLSGYSIFADVQTRGGGDFLQLQVRDGEPSFSIRPKFHVEPRIENYQTLPFKEAFDLPKLVGDAEIAFGLEPGKPLYIARFVSELREDADRTLLEKADKAAFDEANASPALLYYFAGEPDENGRSQSFCLWSDAAEAAKVSRSPAHIDARKYTYMYKRYTFEEFDVHRDSGVLLVPRPRHPRH